MWVLGIEPRSSALEEQSVILTTKPSLQPDWLFFFIVVVCFVFVQPSWAVLS